jgi:hypothetical protein
MERITIKQLEAKVRLLNLITRNQTDVYLPYRKGGKLIANIGTYYIYQAYGGYQLQRICNEGGGASDITPYGTKKELLYQVRAMVEAVEDYQKAINS